MMKFYKMIFFLSMMAGTLITISSYSWLSMWMGLEINLLSIIPLLKTPKNKFPTESAFKYFITQSMASTAFLFSMICSLNLNEQIIETWKKIMMIIFYASILTKMGAAPFHAWFPEVLEGLSWMKCMLMLTWQKIAPMIVLMQNFKLNFFLIIIIVLSSIMGSILALNQISMRKILAYSSINHISWMIINMSSTKMIWTLYFFIYSIISISIIALMESTKTFFIHQMNLFKYNKPLNLLLMMNFLSLGGLPPFLGFLPKWLTINYLINEKNYLMTTLLIIFTLIALFVYTRILFTAMLISSKDTSNLSKQTSKYKIILLNFLTLTSLPICILIFNLY